MNQSLSTNQKLNSNKRKFLKGLLSCNDPILRGVNTAPTSLVHMTSILKLLKVKVKLSLRLIN
jgi:hypothetical protein